MIVRLVESLNDVYRKNARHPVNAAFVLGDIEVAVGNGWLNKRPSNSAELLAAIGFAMPEEARGVISGYVGERPVQVLADQTLKNYLGKCEFCVRYASNTGNIGLGAKVNGEWVMFYKKAYDFGRGLMPNIVGLLDDAVDEYEGKDFRFELVKIMKGI